MKVKVTLKKSLIGRKPNQVKTAYFWRTVPDVREKEGYQ